MAPLPETTGQTNAPAPGGAKPQPVAMEIPVTVNGARTVEGSEKREPFSEPTTTVLVFGSGAVIRLAAAVGPGQLLFVTNEKSKQEVVCQVVKAKQNGSGGGYVELKFTEATVDFWGMRVPGNGALPAAPIAPIAAAPTKSVEQKLTDLKSAPPAATQPALARIAPPPAIAVMPSLTPAAAPVAQASEIQAAPVVPAQPPSTSKVPTLSEFLTHGSNGLELKVPDKPQAQKTQNRETGATAVLTEERPVTVNSGAAQVSRDHDSKPSLSTALGVGQSVAPGSASFDLSADLSAEEVKIPAWLEPLARNSMHVESKLTESKAVDSVGIEPFVEEKLSINAPATDEVAQDHEVVPALTGEGRAPNFGTSLALDSAAAAGSGKGLKIGLLIAALLLAAVAVWYWYVNQPAKVSAGGNATATEGNLSSIPAPSPSATDPEPARSGIVTAASSKTSSQAVPVPPPSANAGSDARPLGSTTIAAAARSSAPSNRSLDTPTEVAADEPAKKPALGQVRLAAPKVTRNPSAAENGAVDPGLGMNGVVAADSSSLSMLTSKSRGPAAPLPVGGDVRVARLLSSVPPVYPQMARTQRVSGDVTIDALIDVNGRVSTMRVVSGPALLHEAAMSAVRQWKYQAAMLNGIPTATHLNVTVQFRLQ
ncbi:MAG TPA: TonB family protein [Candidatus Eisenbacteria bacterium]|nr:TonB family protein [Candidatus Eisenbacteria bacterium]